jgi:tetratricopeptide (TPR) repeat protein
MVPKKCRQWFTFFFIPVFPMGAVKQFVQCSLCKAQVHTTPENLRSQVSRADAQQTQQAIGLYNSLRASPANAVTLNQLMLLYASLKEYDQAISAAADFPQALNASEQCMTTLGRIYLAQNRFTQALQWLDAAVERNPQLGEAQYYKAVTHLLTAPPDFAAAIAAARAARSAQYAGAEALLKDAEEKARA